MPMNCTSSVAPCKSRARPCTITVCENSSWVSRQRWRLPRAHKPTPLRLLARTPAPHLLRVRHPSRHLHPMVPRARRPKIASRAPVKASAAATTKAFVLRRTAAAHATSSPIADATGRSSAPADRAQGADSRSGVRAPMEMETETVGVESTSRMAQRAAPVVSVQVDSARAKGAAI